MSNVSLVANLSLAGAEAFTAAEAPTGGTQGARTLNITGADISTTLDGSSTPKIEVSPTVRKITISGTTTIDLTAAAGVALPISASRTVDNTGKKLVAVRLSCPSTNAGAVNVAPGGSNPYPLFGTGNDIDVKPGQTIIAGIFGVASSYPAVSGTVKNLDVTGTTNDVLNVELYFGT